MKRHKEYKKKVAEALQDNFLREALSKFANDYLESRKKVLSDEHFETKRTEIKEIKNQAMAKLNDLITEFKTKAEESGAKVFQAKDGSEAAKYIIGIAKREKTKLIVKSKSMATEEIELNKALKQNRIEVCETDLGEWIIQLAGERPSHMVMPAIHMTKKKVAELFSRQTGKQEPEDIPHLVKIAREALRDKFLKADIGITGANLGVAENGAIVIISNEGNARLTASLPSVHIVLIGIEKIVPSMKDAATILDVLPRTATGQPITSYISIIKGKEENRELHIILLDNGRTVLSQDNDFKEALRCIRCGSCANVCPVYQIIGGHLFGHIYVGAIGIILTAFIHGMANAAEPMKSCISCRKCVEACPAGIDLEGLITKLRKRLYELEISPFTENLIFRILSQPKLFHTLLRAAWLGQQPISRGRASIRHLPLVFSDWTKNKTLPVIARKPLRDIWNAETCEEETKNTTDVIAKDKTPKHFCKTKAAFFSGCLIDFVSPQIGKSIQKALHNAGVNADFPKAQSCCGYPAWFSGDVVTARKLAEHNTAILSDDKYQYVITGCPTCAMSLKRNYKELLKDSPLREQAIKVAMKTYDFSEFLVNVLNYQPPAMNELSLRKVERRSKPRGLTNPDEASGPAKTRQRVTFHDSCHMRRSLGIYKEPRQLLKNTDKCYLVEMRYPDVCCGQGGSYSIKYPGISDAILKKKIDDIVGTDADVIVSCCPGCLMHIKGGLEKIGANIKVKHIAEMLTD